MQRIVVLTYEGGHSTLRIAAKGFDFFAVHDGRRVIPVKIVSRQDDGCRVEVDGRQVQVKASMAAHHLVVSVDHRTHVFHLGNPLDFSATDVADGNRLIAPMPGFVKIVRTSSGAEVSKGDALVVMEAMKMELTLVAARDGTVEAVEVSEGQQVDEGAVLLTLRVEET